MRLELRSMMDRLMHPSRRHLCQASSRLHQTVVTSTVLWRNAPQLAVLCRDVLPRLIATRGGCVRVAIHGGSIGCEAVSLMIAATEAGIADRLNVHSFDIDPDAVAHAGRGVYGQHYLLEPGNPTRTLLPDDLKKRYLAPEGDAWRVRTDIHEAITFNTCDATSRAQVDARGPFDLIMLQNVLPHLRLKRAMAAVDNLREALTPHGVLALGGTAGNVLAYLAREAELSPVHRDDRAVYDAWSNRQAIWKRDPFSNLGLEPFGHHPDAPQRYAHLFCRASERVFWAERAMKEAA